jgi:hypothetical protein
MLRTRLEYAATLLAFLVLISTHVIVLTMGGILIWKAVSSLRPILSLFYCFLEPLASFPRALLGAIMVEAKSDFYAITRDIIELLSFLGTFLAFIVVTLAAIFAGYQLKEAARARRAQLYTEIKNRWLSPQMQESRSFIDTINRKIVQQSIPGRDSAIIHEIRSLFIDTRIKNVLITADIFEDIGVVCRKKLAKKDDIFDFLGGSVLHYMEILLPYMISVRPAAVSATYANALWLFNAARAHRPYVISNNAVKFTNRLARTSTVLKRSTIF